MGAEQERGHHERQKVVDQPVADQRRGDRARRAAIRDREQDHRLEHADAARDVADQPAQIGEPEQADEGHEPERQAGRQQDVENRRGERPIEQRQSDLRRRDGRSRHVQLPAGEPDRRAPGRGQGDVAGDGDAERQAEHHHDRLGNAEDHGDLVRLAEAGKSEDRAQAEKGRDGVEREDHADVERRQAPRGVQAVAYGTAAQPAEPQIVTERVTGEGRQGGPPVRQALAQVLQRQRVEQGERAVTKRRGDQGERDRARGNLGQAVEQVGRTIRGQLPVNDHDGEGEQDEADDVRQPTREPPVERRLDHLGRCLVRRLGRRGRRRPLTQARCRSRHRVVLQPDSARRLAPAMIFSASAA